MSGASEGEGGREGEVLWAGNGGVNSFFSDLDPVRYEGEAKSLQNRVFQWQYLRPGGTFCWEMRWRETRLRRVSVSVPL